MPKTDHTETVSALRQKDLSLSAKGLRAFGGIELAEIENDYGLMLRVSADLLELHDAGGISLDLWENARSLVERMSAKATGSSTYVIKENHA